MSLARASTSSVSCQRSRAAAPATCARSAGGSPRAAAAAVHARRSAVSGAAGSSAACSAWAATAVAAAASSCSFSLRRASSAVMAFASASSSAPTAVLIQSPSTERCRLALMDPLATPAVRPSAHSRLHSAEVLHCEMCGSRARSVRCRAVSAGAGWGGGAGMLAAGNKVSLWP